MARRARRDLLALISVLVVYYAVPVGQLSDSVAAVLLSVIGLLVGLAGLVWLIVRQVQRLIRTSLDDPAVQADGLILLVFVVVPLFSLGYFALESADADQFVGLATKTDSLYFTLSTLATVGFGDVHAAGQVARALVMVQMTFDLVFIAAVASVLTTHIRRRAAAAISGRPDET
jgi:voltage-gated potassium channel